jgi:hypothetical protein
MGAKLLPAFLYLLLLGLAGCEKPADKTSPSSQAIASSTSSPSPHQVKFDACGLITKEEVEANTGITCAKQSRVAEVQLEVFSSRNAITPPLIPLSLLVWRSHKVIPAPQSKPAQKICGKKALANRTLRKKSMNAIKKKRSGSATERSEKNPIRRKRSTASVMMPSGLGLGLAARFMS